VRFLLGRAGRFRGWPGQTARVFSSVMPAPTRHQGSHLSAPFFVCFGKACDGVGATPSSLRQPTGRILILFRLVSSSVSVAQTNESQQPVGLVLSEPLFIHKFLQFRMLSLGLLQDRDVGIGILPGGEERLVGLPAVGLVFHQSIGPRKAQTCQGKPRKKHRDTRVIQ